MDYRASQDARFFIIQVVTAVAELTASSFVLQWLATVFLFNLYARSLVVSGMSNG